MITRDLQELQELVFRTCVRNMMLLVTLPYHLSQEAPRNPAPDRCRAISNRLPYGSGREDVRWLR
jgi:hypothetical protein